MVTTRAGTKKASAMQLGTTIRHAGIAGSNPLAPTHYAAIVLLCAAG
jgi:hypothetical protein